MSQADEIVLFYVPTGSRQDALILGRTCVEAGLAACANLGDVSSIYPWGGQIQQEGETVLWLKTLPALEDELASFLTRHHAYETPAIVRWNGRVNSDYADWMRSVLAIKKDPD